ncbi:hypothetical protein V7103_21155 [Neobacillus drentensis]|uniref:hypothetical protein n=1 Tax=Neobacillus drentensis TaxID=220684 RepID=UPI003000AD6D
MNKSQIEIKVVSGLTGVKDYKDSEVMPDNLIKRLVIFSDEETCSLNIQSYEMDEILLVECEASGLSSLIMLGSKISEVFNVQLNVFYYEDEWNVEFTTKLSS